MILLDTNVISELVRREPDPDVSAYVWNQPQERLFTAAICEAEIRYGLSRMPEGQRRDGLARRIEALLTIGFGGRVLPFDRACAAICGDIRARREAAGRPISASDAMIAATAIAQGFAVATRNVDDFAGCGTPLVNPWVAAGPPSESDDP